MRTTIVFVVFAAVILAVSAYPYPNFDEQAVYQAYIADEGFEQPAEHDVGAALYRTKRATCDLLSGLGVDHSACAAHCLIIGRRGGYCNSSRVCICRN